ncbi:MAG: autotransporter outer membrane beta-barrel domain-containing protein, partial [Bosea sp. (in: a-proteobacteria)]
EGVTTAVTYTGTQAQLTLTPAPLASVVATNFASPQLGSGNQFRVASALDRAVANGANIDAFFRLYNQNRAGILAGLDQLSGVSNAGAPALGAQTASGFLSAMMNPAAPGRSSAPSGGLITAYAPDAEQRWTPAQLAISNAIGLKSVQGIGDDLIATKSFRPTPIYNVWGSVTGGTGRVDGEAMQGNVRQNSSFGGVAVGVDARVLPETIVGFAMGGSAGSSTSANGLGKVETNLFQLGLYGSTKFGALSLAASGAWLTGSAEGTRAIPVLGQSSVVSKYDLNGLSGRFEAAWAVASLAGVSASPYAAFQAASIRNSSFVETNEVTGVQVGVAGLAKTNLTARAELGLKLESAMRLGSMPATAFIRAGWSHYTARDANMTGQLVGLPGSLFTVTGARPDRNVALLAAGGDVNLTTAVSVGARVDAELGSRTQAASGTANVKWAF